MFRKIIYRELLLVGFAALSFGGFTQTQAQIASGGSYNLSQTVVAAGGDTSSNGAFAVEGTAGQIAAGGYLQNPPFKIYSGFWTPVSLAPTAASVTVSGRVMTAEGQGIMNAVLTLTNSQGEMRTARSASFGYYIFSEVTAGEAYIISISTRRYSFNNPTMVIMVKDTVDGVDFIANPL